jgi:hypothetical protein
MHRVYQLRKTSLRLSPANEQWRGTTLPLQQEKLVGRSSAASFVSASRGIVSCTVRATVSRSSVNLVSGRPARPGAMRPETAVESAI